MIRCLIVEDIRDDIDKLLDYMAAYTPREMEAIAVCDNIEDATQHLQNYPPDLIFLDKELYWGMNGVQYLHLLNSINFRLPPVIMTTAHPPSSMEISQLQRLGQILVLAKPYNEEGFNGLLRVVTANMEDRGDRGTPMRPKSDRHIKVSNVDNKKNGLHHVVDLEHVVFVYAEGNRKLVTLDNGQVMYMWGSFAPFVNYGFQSVHKSFVVNFGNKIADFAYDADGHQLLITTTDKHRHRLDLRPTFNANQLVNYLNMARI
jgi:DNA-binding LytR/AlgR family response regulator